MHLTAEMTLHISVPTSTTIGYAFPSPGIVDAGFPDPPALFAGKVASPLVAKCTQLSPESLTVTLTKGVLIVDPLS